MTENNVQQDVVNESAQFSSHDSLDVFALYQDQNLEMFRPTQSAQDAVEAQFGSVMLVGDKKKSAEQPTSLSMEPELLSDLTSNTKKELANNGGHLVRESFTGDNIEYAWQDRYDGQSMQYQVRYKKPVEMTFMVDGKPQTIEVKQMHSYSLCPPGSADCSEFRTTVIDAQGVQHTFSTDRNRTTEVK